MSEGGVAADNDAESLLDKLRSGEYSDVIKTAQQASESKAQAQLCLQADGSVARGDPSTAFRGMRAAPAPVDEKEDEWQRLRAARMARLRDEDTWRRQGHGKLRELADEREFVEAIRPHERAVALLDDGRSAVADDVRGALESLAKCHMETLFCRLPADRAMFLTHMVELEGLPTIFVLRDGAVRRHLPPSRLFEYASASSPLFKGHLARLLQKVDAVTSDDKGSSSEEEEEKHERRRGR